MSEEPAKQRIGFIDLAKGVCIILVVAMHCGVPVDCIPGLKSMRMPLYFVLSGLFFKDYGGWVNFLVRKTNKLLVPFLFWYLLGCTVYYALSLVNPSILDGNRNIIWNLFNSHWIINLPIWFLPALFWCNVLFCTISLYVKKDALRILLVCLLGSLGVYLGQKEIFVPLFMDTALTSLPFFACGYYLKHSGILYPNRCDRYNVLFAFLAWGGAYALSRCTECHSDLRMNLLYGGSAAYASAILSVLAVLFLCKMIKQLPFVSYIGRYSIVLLCVHFLIMRFVETLLSMGSIEHTELWFRLSYALAILVLSALMIPVCRKLLPWFAAQKDLIKLPASLTREASENLRFIIKKQINKRTQHAPAVPGSAVQTEKQQ
ncbi:MAG: acyltransferase [Akkermansiaceae bacterium]|nr:acyltransferase [Akkermansiaceae bacterium]